MKELGADKFEIVVPSSRSWPSRRWRWSTRWSMRRARASVAEEYLKYLYSPEGQEIAAQELLPPARAGGGREVQGAVPADRAVHHRGISAAGKAQKKHFADGGVFDQTLSAGAVSPAHPLDATKPSPDHVLPLERIGRRLGTPHDHFMTGALPDARTSPSDARSSSSSTPCPGRLSHAGEEVGLGPTSGAEGTGESAGRHPISAASQPGLQRLRFRRGAGACGAVRPAGIDW